MYKREIVNEFINANYLTEEQAQNLISSDNFSVADIVKSGFCTKKQALDVMAKYYGLNVCDVQLIDVDQHLISSFSQALMLKNKFLPVSLVNGELTVAIANPTNPMALSPIRAIHQGKITYLLSNENDLIDKVQSIMLRRDASTALQDLSEKHTDNMDDFDEGENEIQNAPAVKLVDSLINEAISLKASDIHIEPFEKSVRVRYRIDGSLYLRAEFPIDSYPATCARLKILAGINIAEHRIPQDGRFNLTVNGVEYDFRISTLPTSYGEKFVVRILDKSSFNFSRKELGFSDEETVVVDKILSHPYGIVLLTGPTGCGKSTTLYSFLKELNKEDTNIVTVEDPVEYTLPGINQTQVNTKANLTFASALRSILRQDPNVIMIGEIRDEETAQIAIRAAITGHLVFSTLHTNDAAGSINRLIDMGIPPYLVADAVVGVIAQRLVKKLCPICKEKA
ncbi:MAG: type II/IV secretion system protein, partial [Clostridia bacterium]|nr:type II/IV secretion system protein [Clostridia bacterium]